MIYIPSQHPSITKALREAGHAVSHDEGDVLIDVDEITDVNCSRRILVATKKYFPKTEARIDAFLGCGEEAVKRGRKYMACVYAGTENWIPSFKSSSPPKYMCVLDSDYWTGMFAVMKADAYGFNHSGPRLAAMHGCCPLFFGMGEDGTYDGDCRVLLFSHYARVEREDYSSAIIKVLNQGRQDVIDMVLARTKPDYTLLLRAITEDSAELGGYR